MICYTSSQIIRVFFHFSKAFSLCCVRKPVLHLKHLNFKASQHNSSALHILIMWKTQPKSEGKLEQIEQINCDIRRYISYTTLTWYCDVFVLFPIQIATWCRAGNKQLSKAMLLPVLKLWGAAFILVNIRLYWHFLTFFNTDGRQVVEIFPCRRHGSAYSALAIPGLLIA